AALLRRWVNGPEWKPTEPDGSWKGSAGDLRALLMRDGTAPPKGWPATARSMSSRLKRVAPALRHLGVIIEQGKRTEFMRPWIIRRTEIKGRSGQSSEPSFASAVGADQQERHDANPDGWLTQTP